MAKKQKKHDLQGNALRAVFTRIQEHVFAMLEEDADGQKRSVSQQAALIIEQHYRPIAETNGGKP
jgi:hypothetical protein